MQGRSNHFPTDSRKADFKHGGGEGGGGVRFQTERLNQRRREAHRGSREGERAICKIGLALVTAVIATLSRPNQSSEIMGSSLLKSRFAWLNAVIGSSDSNVFNAKTYTLFSNEILFTNNRQSLHCFVSH